MIIIYIYTCIKYVLILNIFIYLLLKMKTL